MFYRYILKPIFFRFDPEAVHDFMTWAGEYMGRFALTRKIVSLLYNYRGKDKSKVVDGIKYRTPILLSAGFDYNGHLSQILPCIGLGGEEIGSVTARPCEGNQKPRLKRLPRSQSIIVNKGLRNDGVDRIIERLRNVKKHDFIIGISIAMTNDPRSVEIRDAIADYLYSFTQLNKENVGDYYTINISCPNAFGGENFTTPERLDMLVSALSAVKCDKPVYLKMPINLSWDQFDALLKIINNHLFIKGVVIGNLNKDYSCLKVRNEAPQQYCGGLSGEPCRELSTELIKKTRNKYGSRFTIIGVGGIQSPEMAKDKIKAGADLIQLITGLIYEGPSLVKKIAKYL